MLRTIRAIFDEMAAQIERRAAEIRTGTEFVNAVAADEFNSKILQLAAGNHEQAERLRQGAIMLGQLNVQLEDIEPAIRQYITSPHRVRYELEMLKRHIDARVTMLDRDGN